MTGPRSESPFLTAIAVNNGLASSDPAHDRAQVRDFSGARAFHS